MAVVTPSVRRVPAIRRWRANRRMLHAGLVRSRYRMAVLARKNLVIRRIDMAIAAHRPVVRNHKESMVENGAKPCRGRVGRVAGHTILRVVP